MSEPTFDKPEFNREIRLGLVVYGGVALAIYMNGVCREFYNAVRGRGVYKLVKALTDSDIIVDIISGTSAGGINGVLLSYALANSSASHVVDFKNFAQIWRESGDILKLMREPGFSASPSESVLDGEGYYQTQLKDAFETAFARKEKAPDGEWFSDFGELDLFVTGTDYLGRVSRVLDDTGRAIEIKDHRCVFLLKHRRGRKEPFQPSELTHESLAKLCRITSCFPVAFPVVNVTLNGTSEVDRKLVEWGQLERRELPNQPPDGSYPLYFVDGGVLDNRPFSYTIKEMYYRMANCPVDRRLFYIDPSPEQLTASERFQKMPKPNTLQVIQDSLVGIPMYESISKDLEAIEQNNEKVRRYRSLLADAETQINLNPTASEEIGIKETIYLRSRLISLRDRILPLILNIDRRIFIDPHQEATLERVAKLLAERITQHQEQEKRQEIRESFAEQIRNLDVEYALRKHLYLLQYLCRQLEQEQNRKQYRSLQTLSGTVTRQIKLLEVIREALSRLLSHPPTSESFYQLLETDQPDNQVRTLFYDRLLRLHRFLLDTEGVEEFSPEEDGSYVPIPADIFQTLPARAQNANLATGEEKEPWLPQPTISSLLAQFQQKIDRLAKPQALRDRIWQNPRYSYDYRENEAFRTILRQVELATEALIEASELQDWQEIRLRFRQFRELDLVLYPFEYLTDLDSKEMVRTVRVSPSDAKMGLAQGKKLEDKLAGDVLNAFGGFFKKSWRSNDILWGRLDGLNRLIEALVTSTSVQRFPEFLKRQGDYPEDPEDFETFKANYLEYLVNESLPEAQPETRQKIISNLTRLASPTGLTERRRQAIVTELVENLVLEGHREILRTDLQNVLQDAISEQLAWNQQRVEPEQSGTNAPPQAASLPKYQPVVGYFDRPVSALAAGKLAEEALTELTCNGQQRQEEFFRDKYDVGRETVLEGIPNVVLANIATRFGLIFRNIVLTTLGDRARLFRRTLSYNFLNRSLQLFYLWLQVKGPLAVQTPKFRVRRPFFLAVQLVLLAIAIIGVAVTVSQSWVPLVVAVLATVLFWLLSRI